MCLVLPTCRVGLWVELRPSVPGKLPFQPWVPREASLEPALCPAFRVSVVSLAPWWPVIFQQLRASLIRDLRAICMAWRRPGFWSGEHY